jgi:hypothetical protein
VVTLIWAIAEPHANKPAAMIVEANAVPDSKADLLNAPGLESWCACG